MIRSRSDELRSGTKLLNNRSIIQSLSADVFIHMVINYLAFFVSTLLNYAKTFPSGNAALNTKRTTGPAMIN